MDIKVEIISKEIIKPSSPSPKSPKSHKLSLLDQKAPNCYTTFILFYHKNSSSSDLVNVLDSLKVSLSKTLNHMNQLAGRVKDGFTVECNGQGVAFLCAKVHEDMSSVLENLKIQVLRKLLPLNPLTRSDDYVLLALQITCFVCGGIAIGICISHLIADGSSVATFLNTWACISRAKNDSINISDNLFMDCTSIFPPKEVHSFSVFQFGGKDQIPPKMAARRFVFDESNILALKTKAERSTSRVEAVLAFVWEAVIAAMQKRNNNSAIKNSVIRIPIDLRRRIQPPLPQQTMGNIIHMAEANWEVSEGALDYKSLVKKVQDSIKNVTKHGYDAKNMDDRVTALNKEVGILSSTSLCKLPFYDIDFGWGRPKWASVGAIATNLVVLMDTRDGKGIEVWLGLVEEDMAILETNQEFFKLVSLSRSIF
ncbi:hypothetical protein RND71_028498 [Anisodus tanguticus]|uniref:Uncharacterized protein n=1 Tax=Anisodus tanguticus TaxID=243964 RepID=A0AAE1RJX1_9SOLA|nr:hypothetical protein RND71_028498 [Anisodus tanguticus]